MSTKPNPQAPDAQAQIRRRNAFKRACERSFEIPGVREFDSWVRDLFDPRQGVSTKRPGKDRHWFDNEGGFPTPVRSGNTSSTGKFGRDIGGPELGSDPSTRMLHGKSSPPMLPDALGCGYARSHRARWLARPWSTADS